MSVTVHVKATNETIVFQDAKATTKNRPGGNGCELTDLYVYQDDERVAHFSAGEWAYWRATDEHA